jgi:hypothetical protein
MGAGDQPRRGVTISSKMNIDIDEITIKAAGATGVATSNTDTRCPHCGSPKADSYYFYGCGVSVGTYQQKRTDVCREREAHNKTREELDEIKETYRNVMEEKCFPNERHCTCVPALRAENAMLRDLAERAIQTFAEKGRSFTAIQLRAELEEITNQSLQDVASA